MAYEQEIAAYMRDGVVAIAGILPREIIEEAQAAWLKLKQDINDGQNTLVRSARFVSGGWLPEALDKLPQHPALIDLARQVLGPDVALYMNRLLVKDDVWNGPVPAHIDYPYFHGSQNKLSIFLPLFPFTKATGNLKFVVGSHLYGNLGRGAIEVEKFPPMPVVQPDAYPGDVILGSFTVWHYSEAAEVASDRPLLQISYQASTDGSYFGEPAEPRLMCGQWRTDRFHRAGQFMIPDS